MKVNFIIPSWHYWKEPVRAQPLTQLYLATLLEEKGMDIEFTDLRDGPKILKEADMYMYTVASPDYKEVQEIVKVIRNIYPKSKHVAGGPHPTILPNETKGFDEVVSGRGEPFIDEITDTKSTDYPFPKRHFLPIEKIVNDNLFKTDTMKSTTAQFSFGCPFNCSFCANYQRGKVKRNSLEKISNEIDYLKSEYGIKGFSLQDEVVLPFRREEAEQLLDLFISKDIRWRGQMRALKDTSILKKAKRSGLVELSFGLESADQNVLDLTNKQVNVENVEKTIYACHENGIKTRVYLLNGLPGEDETIVKQTIDFIEKTNPELVLLSSLQPYPGSPIADNPEKYGIRWVSHDYERFNHLLCRFEDSNDNPEDAVPFEYVKGRGMSRKQIMNNMLDLQSYLRGRDMNK